MSMKKFLHNTTVYKPDTCTSYKEQLIKRTMDLIRLEYEKKLKSKH